MRQEVEKSLLSHNINNLEMFCPVFIAKLYVFLFFRGRQMKRKQIKSCRESREIGEWNSSWLVIYARKLTGTIPWSSVEQRHILRIPDTCSSDRSKYGASVTIALSRSD